MMESRIIPSPGFIPTSAGAAVCTVFTGAIRDSRVELAAEAQAVVSKTRNTAFFI
jgi:hypothetical protein